MVPASVRHQPARLGLAQPGRSRPVRRRDQVLAGPRRGRAAGGRGPRDLQGSRTARPHRPAPAERAVGVPAPAGTAAALPVLAGHPGLLSGRWFPRVADGDRRGLVRRARDPRALSRTRRPASGFQLPADPGRLAGGRIPRRDRLGARRDRRIPRPVGDRQPRRRPPGEPLPAGRGVHAADHLPAHRPRRPERGRGRPACPGGRAGAAGPARLGLYLPGRGTGPARGHRYPGRRAPGSPVLPHQRRVPRPRRLPGASPLVRYRHRIRFQPNGPGFQPRRTVAAPARGLGPV